MALHAAGWNLGEISELMGCLTVMVARWLPSILKLVINSNAWGGGWGLRKSPLLGVYPRESWRELVFNSQGFITGRFISVVINGTVEAIARAATWFHPSAARWQAGRHPGPQPYRQ